LPQSQSRADAEGRLYLRAAELDRASADLFAAARAFWRSAEAPLRTLGLGGAHYRAMSAIRRTPGLRVGQLQEALGVRKQSLARVLSELEAAELIAREPAASDRRARRLTLTDTGHAAEAQVSAALRERLSEVFRAAGAEAVAGARSVWAGLIALDAEGAKP
jgi:DNA-binding MarR family transcriptional regulator